MIEIQVKQLSDGRCQVIIPIHLTPKSSKDEFVAHKDEFDAIKIRLRAVPEDGKANKALIEFLAKSWNIPKTNIEILSGHQSRHKRILIQLLSESEVFFAVIIDSIPGLTFEKK